MAVNTILVVDDEELICEFLKDGLSSHGYSVDTAISIGEAFDLSKEKDYDLIITDVIMDQGDGFDLLQGLRDKNVPIIVISGGGRMNASDYLGMASGLGAFATLQKPFELAKLVEIIKKID